MPIYIANSDLWITQSNVMAAGPTTANIGGTKTTIQITGGILGSVFYAVSSNAAGQGSNIQYAKVFGYNANIYSASAYTCLFWLRNSIDIMTANGQLQITPSGAAEDSTRKVRVIGYDLNGIATVEEVTLNGAGITVSTTTVWSFIARVELRLYTGSTLQVSSGDIQLVNATGSVGLGILPNNKNCATGEIDIALESSQNGSATLLLPTTAPSGVTFSRPRTRAAAIGAVGGTIAAGSGQGIWPRLTIQERMLSSTSATGTITFTASQG